MKLWQQQTKKVIYFMGAAPVNYTEFLTLNIVLHKTQN